MIILYCPCCDGTAVASKKRRWRMRQAVDNKAWSVVLHYIRCVLCGVRTKEYEDAEEARQVWNTRK